MAAVDLGGVFAVDSHGSVLGNVLVGEMYQAKGALSHRRRARQKSGVKRVKGGARIMKFVPKALNFREWT